VERGHTVIYGWQPEIFPMVAELVRATKSRALAAQTADPAAPYGVYSNPEKSRLVTFFGQDR
jgi:hypothetical protein